MTEKFSQFLGEQFGFDEETRTMIQEAWENKLSEAREEISAELREEFSKKFTHDKNVIVESMEQFINAKIQEEIEELAEDKKRLSAETVAYKRRMSEHAEKLNSFIAEHLAKEIKEYRSDRAEKQKSIAVLESFVLNELTKEIREFHQDKKALQEQRVKLVSEGKKALAEAKKKFIKEAAETINTGINKALKGEIEQFRGDIKVARENEFGRKVFEAFATEYMTSYLNEGSEVKKIMSQLAEVQTKLDEAQQQIAQNQVLVEQADKKARIANDRLMRERKLQRLLSPLNKDKRAIMVELLESVKTSDLETAFSKYLPAVLNEKDNTHSIQSSRMLKESTLNEGKTTEKTGDRANAIAPDDSGIKELAKLKELAGITNRKN